MAHLIREEIWHGDYHAFRDCHVAAITPQAVADIIRSCSYVSNDSTEVCEKVANDLIEKREACRGWVTWTIQRYEVLDNNDDVLGATDVWWIAAQSAHDNGFRVRDNDTETIQLDCRPDTERL